MATENAQPGGPERCQCPDCDTEIEKTRGVPCREEKCPECGTMMVAATESESESKARSDQPASDFLVVEEDGTRHLPVKRNGKLSHNLMGAAWAALHGGYRGNKYEGPGKSSAIAKLKKLYASEGMETPKSALLLPMTLTKAERLDDGRVRWRARANSGEFDLENDRFHKSFWDDVIHNFGRQVEATAKGEAPPDNMPIPILDLSHYSFRLPTESRTKAQTGWIERLWQDGDALMALGYFCDTPLGRAAANAAMTRPATERRVSGGGWPDWGRVDLVDGKRIYKGGRNRAYLDHLAQTAHPIDPNTLLEVKSMEQQTDALDVLGDTDESKALVDELEEAKGKALPDGAVVKADEYESVEEPETVEVEAEEPEVEEETEPEPEVEDMPEMLSAADMAVALKSFSSMLSGVLEGKFDGVEKSIAELGAKVDALSADEAEKVKAAIDGDGDWLWGLMRDNSVRGDSAVKGKGKEGPKEKKDRKDPFFEMFGGLVEDE